MQSSSAFITHRKFRAWRQTDNAAASLLRRSRKSVLLRHGGGDESGQGFDEVGGQREDAPSFTYPRAESSAASS
jgi:hypothetical protein